MHIERKLTVATLALLAVCATMAFAQVAPVRRGSSDGSQDGKASGTVRDPNGATNVQLLLREIISWKQMLALGVMGGTTPHDYNSIPNNVKDARMEIVRACNLYQRATLTPPQQSEYDRTILDPKGHPLPPKWETMRLKGTLVTALLKSTPAQEKRADQLIEQFRASNSKFWGQRQYAFLPESKSPYGRHLATLVEGFRSSLNKQQLTEFDDLWGSYNRDVLQAMRSVSIEP